MPATLRKRLMLVPAILLGLIVGACGGASDGAGSLPNGGSSSSSSSGGNAIASKLNVTNHSGGNTGGKGGQPHEGGDTISNFIVDIAVLKAAQLPSASHLTPLVITQSYWDGLG